MKKAISYVIIAPFWIVGNLALWALNNICEDQETTNDEIYQ